MTKTDAETTDLYLGYQAGVDAQRQYSGVGGMITEQTALIYVGQLAVDVYTTYKADWGYGSGWSPRQWQTRPGTSQVSGSQL